MCLEARSASEIAPLHGKLAVRENDKLDELAFLSNSDKPGAREKAAIAAFDRVSRRCLELVDSGYVRFGPPGIAPYVSDMRLQFRLILAELYAAKLTFGEANRRLLENSLRFDRELNDRVAKWTAEIQAARNAEQERRSAEQRAAAQAVEAERAEAQRRFEAERIEAQRQAELQRMQALRAAELERIRRDQNQREAEALMNLGQQLMRPQRPPVNTNCIRTAVGVNCSTW